MHALAVLRILRLALNRHERAIVERIRQLYPRVLEWHRYLAKQRDPSGTGLLVIYHPWESGTDNSPRWDSAMARLQVGEMAAYQRHDLKHVEDPSERPTHSEYDRYLWLVELLKTASYDDATIQRDYPFQVRDVLMSAIFALACSDLAEVASSLGREQAETFELSEYASRFSRGVEQAWDADLSLALDSDVVAGGPIRVQTCAGLAPVLLPSVSPELLRATVDRLSGEGFAGAPGLAFQVVPSTAPNSPGFHPRSYWRGPSWPVANWLFWQGLLRQGEQPAAARLRAANLALLDRPTAQFAEYFEAFTAEPLGSLEQSWTAAVALDWLAVGPGQD